MTKTVKNRLIKILFSLLILIVAVLIIILNLRDNIVYFYSPTELSKMEISEKKNNESWRTSQKRFHK